MKRLAFVLTLLVALSLAPITPALNPLDSDAGSGGDAGDSERNATPVAPGLHRGRVTSPHDSTDWFVFPVLAGQEVTLAARTLQGAATVDLRDGDAPWHSTGSRLKATADGYAFIRAHNDDPVASRYAFTLTVSDPVPQDDGGSGGDADEHCADGVRATSRTVTGYLYVHDVADCYHLPLRANETVTVRVDANGTDVPVDLGLASAFTRTTWLEDGVAVTTPRPDTLKLSARLPWDASAAEAGAYRLVVTREGGDGDLPAPLPVLRAISGAPARVWGVHGLPDGRAVATNGSGIWELAPTGARLIDARHDLVTHVTADADGDLVAFDARSLTLREMRADADVPFLATLAGVRGAAFGPGSAEGAHDGALYVADMVRTTVWDRFNHSSWYENHQALLRVDADGTVTTVASGVPFLYGLAFAPDGTLYALESGRGGIRTVDTVTGDVTRVASPPRCCLPVSDLAVDTLGRVYALDRWSGAIMRWTPSTDAWDLVAWGPREALDLAFGGHDLYVRSPAPEGGGAYEASVVTLDAPGFGGFAGTFHAPPVADLVVSDVREERPVVAESPAGPVHPEVAEKRTLLVDVTNAGAGDFNGRVEMIVSHEYPEWMGRIGEALVNATLEPGETTTIAFEWDTTTDPGYQEIDVRMRARDALDANVTNNGYRYETGVVTDCVSVLMFGFGLPCAGALLGWE